MPHPSENDPLLPATAPSPEISQHGSQASHSEEVKWNGLFNDRQQSYSTLSAPPAYSSRAQNSIPTEIEYEQRSHDATYGVHDRRTSTGIIDEDSSDSESDDEGTDRALRKRVLNSVISVFAVVMFFALVVLSFNGGSSNGDGKPLPLPTATHPASSSLSSPSPSPSPKKSLDEQVHSILTTTPLIDGHDDLAIYLRLAFNNTITSSAFRAFFEEGNRTGLPPGNNVDIQRLRNGLVGGAFWSTFVACPPNASHDFSDANYGVEVSHTLQQIDLMKRLQSRYPDVFIPTDPGLSSEELLQIWHDSNSTASSEAAYKKILGMLSIEGLHQLPPTAPLSTLRLYYALGVRAATLTWNCHNLFADASLVMEPPDWSSLIIVDQKRHRGGITKAGAAVVREMNRLGMLIDISHTSWWTQRAVLNDSTTLQHPSDKLRGSRAPVIFSHSSAHAICPHPRNVRDDVLRLVKETGSLVMINFTPSFISCNPSPDPESELPPFYEQNSTLHQIVRHITYVGELIGYEHVGLGSDFDGMSDPPPKGMEGVDKFPDLVKALLKHGVKEDDVRGVVGGNLLRVWKRAEEVAKEMKAEGITEGVDEVEGF